MEMLITSHLATFEAFRKLGFQDEQLSVRNTTLTVLKVGELEFTVNHDVDDPVDPGEFEQTWRVALAAWSERSAGERRHVYTRIYDAETLADLAQAISKKGIKIPKLDS